MVFLYHWSMFTTHNKYLLNFKLIYIFFNQNRHYHIINFINLLLLYYNISILDIYIDLLDGILLKIYKSINYKVLFNIFLVNFNRLNIYHKFYLFHYNNFLNLLENKDFFCILDNLSDFIFHMILNNVNVFNDRKVML